MSINIEHNNHVVEIMRLQERIKDLETELERERIRLGACGFAALGYLVDCKDEYKSASLGDVQRIRKSFCELQELNENLINTIKNDAYAITFQSMNQYRQALITIATSKVNHT